MLSEEKWQERQEETAMYWMMILGEGGGGTEKQLALYLNKYYIYTPIQYLHVLIWTASWWRGPYNIIKSTWTDQMIIFFRTWHHWIWNFSVSADYYCDGTWHMVQPERCRSLTEQFHTVFFLCPLFLWFWNSDCNTEKTAHTYYRN